MKLAKKRKDASLMRRFFDNRGNKIILTFRGPKPSDAKAAMNFINSFVDEKAYVSTTKKITLKQEKEWLKKQLKKAKKRECASIFAFHSNKLIGSCGVERCDTTTSHTGKIGIAIAKGYRRIGLGKFMMQLAMEKARKQLKSEIIILHVYSRNKPAQKLYRKLGFKTAGKIPKGIKHYGKYMDDILMYKRAPFSWKEKRPRVQREHKTSK